MHGYRQPILDLQRHRLRQLGKNADLIGEMPDRTLLQQLILAAVQGLFTVDPYPFVTAQRKQEILLCRIRIDMDLAAIDIMQIQGGIDVLQGPVAALDAGRKPGCNRKGGDRGDLIGSGDLIGLQIGQAACGTLGDRSGTGKGVGSDGILGLLIGKRSLRFKKLR